MSDLQSEARDIIAELTEEQRRIVLDNPRTFEEADAINAVDDLFEYEESWDSYYWNATELGRAVRELLEAGTDIPPAEPKPAQRPWEEQRFVGPGFKFATIESTPGVEATPGPDALVPKGRAPISELKPCPFCGSEPLVLPVDPEREGDAWTTIRCNMALCPVTAEVTVHKETGHREEAIAAWNRRA